MGIKNARRARESKVACRRVGVPAYARIVLVLVLVLDQCSIGVAGGQGLFVPLEGSRFGLYLANPRNFCPSTSPAETGVSRRLPGTTHQLAALWSGCKRSESLGKRAALDYSQEPPVATFFGRMKRSDEYREVVWYAPKRLPSRRWEQTQLVRPH